MLRFALLCAIGVLLILWDPFGIGDATARYSVDVFHQIVGSRYPVGREPAPEMPSDWISVVLVEDRTFEDTLQEAWPIRYGQHARILRRILDRGPAAVFVDFLFLDEHRNDRSINSLKAVVEEYRRAGIPLVFADAAFGLGAAGAAIATLGKDAKATLAQVAWRNSSDIPSYYPIRVRPADDEVSLPERDSAADLTPAVQLYEQLCPVDDLLLHRDDSYDDCERDCLGAAAVGRHAEGADWNAECKAKCTFCRASWKDTDEMCGPVRESRRGTGDKCPPLHIDWGSRPLSTDRPGRYANCAPDVMSQKSLSLRVLQRLFVGAEAFQTDCYFHETILADHVLFPAAVGEDYVNARLHGHVVFYGARIAGIPDVVDSPTRATLPGVHVHAMAFDNLATYGSDYKGSLVLQFWLFSSEDMVQAVALPFYAVVFLLAAWLAEKVVAGRLDAAGVGLPVGAEERVSATCHRLFALIALLATTGCVWIASYQAYVRVGLPPLDWLAVATAAALARLVVPVQAKTFREAISAAAGVVDRIVWLVGARDHLPADHSTSRGRHGDGPQHAVGAQGEEQAALDQGEGHESLSTDRGRDDRADHVASGERRMRGQPGQADRLREARDQRSDLRGRGGL